MLRVCTNVKTKDNRRAVGTFIPAVNPDGTPNPVIATVLKGETYVGRAFVVNDWYMTAYEPIYDAEKRVVGTLFVGTKLENVAALRKGISQVPVGKSGYVYVLNGSGSGRGTYVLSKDGKRDGECLWDAKDDGGTYFIRDIVNGATKTTNGDCIFVEYPWKNQGEDQARVKIAAATYFEPWDWVIASGVYRDDFAEMSDHIDTSLASLLW